MNAARVTALATMTFMLAALAGAGIAQASATP